MKTVNIHAAKTHLSSLVEEVAAGAEIIIAKAGKPRARLVPLAKPIFTRKPGMWKDLIKVHANFDDPLPPDIAEAFGIIDEPSHRHPRPDLVVKK
ncbi:MAG: type II toxin-antitoxin system prevent-host-death family antitoxin [Bryobacteraceae bacterium]|jgi:prevent-host-death family protein